MNGLLGLSQHTEDLLKLISWYFPNSLAENATSLGEHQNHPGDFLYGVVAASCGASQGARPHVRPNRGSRRKLCPSQGVPPVRPGLGAGPATECDDRQGLRGRVGQPTSETFPQERTCRGLCFSDSVRRISFNAS